jgi:hypothetical protein
MTLLGGRPEYTTKQRRWRALSITDLKWTDVRLEAQVLLNRYLIVAAPTRLVQCVIPVKECTTRINFESLLISVYIYKTFVPPIWYYDVAQIFVYLLFVAPFKTRKALKYFIALQNYFYTILCCINHTEAYLKYSTSLGISQMYIV